MSPPFLSSVEQTCFGAVTKLLSKVAMPYGGASVIGLTNLLYEVAMPHSNDTAYNLSTPDSYWFRPESHRLKLYSYHLLCVLERAPRASTGVCAGAFTFFCPCRIR